jgi:hypothetical protein
MYRILLAFCCLQLLQSDEVLDQLQSVNDPIAFNSTVANDVVRSLFVSVAKKISDTGDDDEVFVRLYTPIQSSDELKTISDDGLSNLSVTSQFISLKISEVLRQGGVFVPVVIRFHPNQNEATKDQGYSIQLSGISQNIDINLVSPTYLRLPSVALENNMHNQQVIATNPNRSQDESNALNEGRQNIVFSQFFQGVGPLTSWFANNIAYFSNQQLSVNLIDVPADKKELKELKVHFFLPACGLENLSEGSYSYRYIMKMVPRLLASTDQTVTTLTSDFSNIEQQIRYYTFSLTTIEANLKNTNQITSLTPSEIALYNIRQIQLMKKRAELTKKFLAYLEKEKKKASSLALLTTIEGLISTYSANLDSIYLNDLAQALQVQGSVISSFEKSLDKIMALQEQEVQEIEKGVDFSTADTLNTIIITDLTTHINQVVATIVGANNASSLQNILEYQVLFLIDELYREYNTQKFILRSAIDALEKGAPTKALVKKIDPLIKIVEARLSGPIFPSTLSAILTNNILSSVQTKINSFRANESASLATTTLAGYNSLEGQRIQLEDEIITLVNQEIQASSASAVLQQFQGCQIDFFLGLSTFYLETLRELNDLKIQSQQNNSTYWNQQKALEAQIEAFKKNQLLELSESDAAQKEDLNTSNLKTIRALIKLVQGYLTDSSLTLFQYQYYKAKLQQLTALQVQEQVRQ